MKFTKELLKQIFIEKAKKHMIAFNIHDFERDYPSLSLTIYVAMAESYMNGYRDAGIDAINILKKTDDKS